MTSSFRTERDSMGELQGARRCAVGRADAARRAELSRSAGSPCRAPSSPRSAWSSRPPRAPTRRCGLLPDARSGRRRSQAAAAEVADGPARRAVPHRCIPDRLGHQHQHERQRGDRRAGQPAPRAARCIRTTTSTWARAATTSIPTAIHVSAALAVRRDAACPRSSTCATTLRAKEQEVGRHRQDRPHAPDGCDAGDAVTGALGLAHADRERPGAAAGGRAAAAGSWRRAAPPSAPASMRIRTSARASARSWPPSPACRSSRRAIISRRMSAQDTAVELSGQLKVIAVSLMKIANDLRWMNSGPLAGPGRDRPAGAAARQQHHAGQGESGDPRGRRHGGRAGHRQRRHHHHRRPVGKLPAQRDAAGDRLQPAAEHRLLANVARALADSAIAGFTVNKARLAEALDRNPILVTALNPVIGYEKGAAIAKKAYAQGRADSGGGAADDRPAARGAGEAPRPGGAHHRRHQGRHERRRLSGLTADPAGRRTPAAGPRATGPAIIRERLAGSAAAAPRSRSGACRDSRPTDSQRYRSYFPANPCRPRCWCRWWSARQLTVLLTQRATQLRNHAGQISFPGGRIEPAMAGPRAAALREAHEEIGLEPGFVAGGRLPAGPRGDDRVSRHAGGRLRAPGLRAAAGHRARCEDTFEVPLDFVFDPANHRAASAPLGLHR